MGLLLKRCECFRRQDTQINPLGWCVFASKEYAVLYGLPKTPEDLRDHRLILYTETRHHLTGLAWMEQYKSDDDKFSRVNTSSVALRAVLAGAGIVTLPAYEGAEHFSLVRVFLEPFYFQPAFLVYHESLRDSARIRAVFDELTTYLDRKKLLLLGKSE